MTGRTYARIRGMQAGAPKCLNASPKTFLERNHKNNLNLEKNIVPKILYLQVFWFAHHTRIIL